MNFHQAYTQTFNKRNEGEKPRIGVIRSPENAKQSYPRALTFPAVARTETTRTRHRPLMEQNSSLPINTTATGMAENSLICRSRSTDEGERGAAEPHRDEKRKKYISFQTSSRLPRGRGGVPRRAHRQGNVRGRFHVQSIRVANGEDLEPYAPSWDMASSISQAGGGKEDEVKPLQKKAGRSVPLVNHCNIGSDKKPFETKTTWSRLTT